MTKIRDSADRVFDIMPFTAIITNESFYNVLTDTQKLFVKLLKDVDSDVRNMAKFPISASIISSTFFGAGKCENYEIKNITKKEYDIITQSVYDFKVALIYLLLVEHKSPVMRFPIKMSYSDASGIGRNLFFYYNVLAYMTSSSPKFIRDHIREIMLHDEENEYRVRFVLGMDNIVGDKARFIPVPLSDPMTYIESFPYMSDRERPNYINGHTVGNLFVNFSLLYKYTYPINIGNLKFPNLKYLIEISKIYSRLFFDRVDIDKIAKVYEVAHDMYKTIINLIDSEENVFSYMILIRIAFNIFLYGSIPYEEISDVMETLTEVISKLKSAKFKVLSIIPKIPGTYFNDNNGHDLSFEIYLESYGSNLQVDLSDDEVKIIDSLYINYTEDGP